MESGAEREREHEGCEERLSCSPRYSAEPHREEEIGCLLSGPSPEVPWRLENLQRSWMCLVPRVHFLSQQAQVPAGDPPPTTAHGLWAELPDRGQVFPQGPPCSGTCVEAAASSKMKRPFMQVSPHLAALNHALPTTIAIPKK